MKNLNNKRNYDRPEVEAIKMTVESTILGSSGDEEQLTPKPFFGDTDQL